jgi:tape measure domain-containing protein
MSEIVTMAAKTPFEAPDLTQGAKKLLAYGTNAKNIMPALKMLGDISLGNKDKFNSLSLAFGQITAKGRLQGDDLRQLTEAGFNPLQIMADKTGKSYESLRKQMEAGKFSIKDVVVAMQVATSEGGRFFDAMNKQSKTFGGQWSTVKDNVNMALGEAFKPLFSFLTTKAFPALNASLTDSSSKLNQFFKGLAQSIDFLATKVLPKAPKIAYGIGEVAAFPIRVVAAMNNAPKDYRGKNYDNSFQFKPKPLGFIDNKLDWTGKSTSTKELFGFKSEPAKNAFETYGEVIPVPGFDFSLISGLGDEIAEGTEKAKNELESFVDKVKSQAERFRDALGLFDKATTEKISGGALLSRLKGQINILTGYRDNLDKLRGKFGAESLIFKDLEQRGPQAAGQIAALARSSDSLLNQYSSLFNEKSGIAGGLGTDALKSQYLQEKKTAQVVVQIQNAYGDNIKELAEKVFEEASKSMRLAGVY